ncbi:uncharacterized protein LOC107611427 [Arachis ipaensis]|uniref:uncharacterized protein LOC107611427 n=1 Tax=Arachis ipaensis TaxID=130454 RepID=UPI0007AF0125|nr:uncharacterized protein LOC107611427 [Arachis ipaensis]XP_025670497.1 uncharacterized protein LOC112770340 [Arachis hypogaea]
MPRKPRYTISNATGVVAGPNSQTHATPQTDGTHDTGEETSSAQRRARAPPPPRSGNGARQSRVNAVPFRPPRNETRMASSSDVGDTRAPATNRKHPPDSHEGVDDHSEDEDYNPEADEIESFDDHLDNMFAAHEVEHQVNVNRKKKDTNYWVVDVIENGVISSMELTVKEALALPPGKKISWKTMSKASKEHAYDQVKRVFHYEDDKRGWIKREILQRIGNCWRNSRNHLFHKVYDEELTFEENIKRKPVGIEANHWKKFLQYRLDDDTQEKCRKNAVNRSKQQYTHTGGSKTMARKRHEEEQRLGRPIGRGEGWTMSHKKKNGKYMNEEARLVGEAIEFVESQDPSSKEFSQNDSLAQVLGKEHPGRVRGLGIGTCPSRCFRNIPEQSDYGVQIEEYQMEIVKLKAEAAELKAEAAELKAAAAEEKTKRQRMEAEAAEEKAKRQIMETEAAEGKAKIQTMGDLLTYVIQQQGGHLPPEIAADLDSLRSAPTSSHAR